MSDADTAVDRLLPLASIDLGLALDVAAVIYGNQKPIESILSDMQSMISRLERESNDLTRAVVNMRHVGDIESAQRMESRINDIRDKIGKLREAYALISEY